MASMKSSPQKSLALSWGSCFRGTNVSWNRAGDFRPERSSEFLLTVAPAFSLPPPPSSSPDFSLSGTLTCGNEPALQCTTSRYCCRERAGRDSVLREGNGWMVQCGKMKRIEIPGIIFVQQCFCYVSFFWPLCSPQHGAVLAEISKH